MTTSKVTTDHQEIRRWVEMRGGHPAAAKSADKPQRPAVLRIDFPGFTEAEHLVEVPWDEWFATFEARELAFLYQDRTADGRESRLNKLVSRAGAGK
ncbi:MAG: hypothetical protein ABW321_34630 [Polyangiales bacterium]